MIYTIGCEVGTPSTVEECLSYFENSEEIEVDTETTGQDPHQHKIVSLQLGDVHNQWFIDTRKVDILLFKELLETKTCLLQNAKFDYKMLKKHGIILNRIYDTMLAECVLYCGYENWGYSLNELHERYLDKPLSKEERLEFLTIGERPFTLRQVEYGCRDVACLGEIKARQMLRIQHCKLEYCLKIENEAVKALADIEYNGMLLDAAEWSEVTKFYKAEAIKIQKDLDRIILAEPALSKLHPQGTQGNLFGFEERSLTVNYNSSAQMLKICHLLGYPVESTNEREIGKLAKTEDGQVLWAKHPFFGALLLSREVGKILSTYGDSFLKYINPATGRVHTDFWQIKDTGRVGSGSKDRNAPNVQNIPGLAKEEVIGDKKVTLYPFRNAFKARPGFSWVSIDYSGQELRLMADASGEEGFIRVLNTPGMDLHCYAGEMMFKRPIDKKKDKALRNKAKTINFGKPYGMGPDKLADSLGITKEEAEDLFRQYAEAFPALNKWLEDQGKLAISRGYSRTFSPCGRIRWFPDIKKSKQLRETAQKGQKETWRDILTIEGQTQRNGMNSPIQGTGADITKEALIKVRELILDLNEEQNEEVAFLICTVHDAIDCEVREDLAEDFANKMAEIMIACGNKYVSKVKMEVDITITPMWTK